ncbi:MAG TPA: branched-chain amino acid transaminase [Longimicrobiales bacterium]|nr:branched-chain amino acid transaminase [Longimicrobiales bacterium]
MSGKPGHAGVIHTPWIWHNGDFVPWDSANLHVMSHVVHYGSSVFEGIRCYATREGPSLLRLDDHLRRLLDSCRIHRIPVEYDVAFLRDACCKLFERNELEEGYLRPLVLRGEGAVGIHPGDARVETFLICWPWGAYLGKDAHEAGVDACVSTWFRPAPNTHPTLAKCAGNYPLAQLMKMEAAQNGYTEAIALAPDGTVSEASAQNVFLVKGGILYTPPADGSMLSGITRDSTIVLAQDAGIAVREERIPREKLYICDELFLTGTATEITPVRSVDRIPVAGGTRGPITELLQRRLLEVAMGRAPDPHGWRTVVRGRRSTRVA